MESQEAKRIPHFVKEYCANRFTEIIQYLTETQYKRLYRTDGVKIKVLGNEGDLIRCFITRPVLPLTITRNPMLLRAAQLEYQTWAVEYPISLQEARWVLIDEYPKTNCIAQPYSCLNLIKEKKGCLKLSLNRTIELSKERKFECTA